MIQRIKLHNAVPEIFAKREDLRSDIWLQDVAFERGHTYLIEAESGTGKSSLCSYLYGQRGDYRGSILFDDAGKLHMYAYNKNDEQHMDHVVSEDCGHTWGEPAVCLLNEGIRNPQTAQLDGVYILHGRNAALKGFVFYTSLDGQNWDEGTDLGHEEGSCYYSNNIVLQDKDGNNRLLVQYSEMYGREMCVNVKHVWLTVKK